MIIAVDFDGTIVPDEFFPNKIPDRFMPGAKEALEKIHNTGHRLVLWTLRDNGMTISDVPRFQYSVSAAMYIAIEFLKSNGLDFIELPVRVFGIRATTWKIPADMYIDDKVPGGFAGWDTILKHLGL
jgi:hypothetical protein